MKIRLEGLPAVELIAALYSMVRRRRKGDAPVGAVSEAWLAGGALQEHPAVAMTLAFWALGFDLSSAARLALHHGPMPAFQQRQPYPESLLGRVPAKRMAELFDLPPSPQAVLQTYADVLREYWRLSNFQAVLDGLEADARAAAQRLGPMLPDQEEVDSLRFLLQGRSLPDLWVVPILFTIFEERAGIDLDSELCLMLGVPGPQVAPGRGRYALSMGLRYHLLAKAVGPLLEAHRPALARSEGLFSLLEDKGLGPNERDWFRLVMRQIVFGLSYWVEARRHPPEWERATSRYTAGGPLHLLPWFSGQIQVYLNERPEPDLGELTERLVTRLADEQAEIRRNLAYRPFPESLRGAFSPYWQRRETVLVLPPADRGANRLLEVAERQWQRRLPVIYADGQTPLPDEANLVLYGSPASNPALKESLEWLSQHRAARAGLSLHADLAAGCQVIAACEHPTNAGAFLYVHTADDPARISPMPELRASDIGYVLVGSDGALRRGSWPV